jgi:NDP-sugar pyrophosphorylase family protein
MITQAVILSGGRGERLGKLTEKTPKPLLPVAGKPFLEHIIERLRSYGIRNLLLSVGYLSDRIIDHFGDGANMSVSITYAVEDEPAGTGGALLLARDQLDEAFLVLNGDTLFDIDYTDLVTLYRMENGRAAIALREVEDARGYGTVSLQNYRINGFYEKGRSGPGTVNGGIYVLGRDCVDEIEAVPSSLEEDLFPSLASKGVLVGKTYGGFFIDIGIPERYRQAEILLPGGKNSRRHAATT